MKLPRCSLSMEQDVGCISDSLVLRLSVNINAKTNNYYSLRREE